jgi:hypothetical protein
VFLCFVSSVQHRSGRLGVNAPFASDILRV